MYVHAKCVGADSELNHAVRRRKIQSGCHHLGTTDWLLRELYSSVNNANMFNIQYQLL